MNQAAKAVRPARPKAEADSALAQKDAPAMPAEKPAPRTPDGAAVPIVTSQDPWRYLHPSRVWPD